MWLELLHCYLLPLITFHSEDFQAVSQTQAHHLRLLSSIDESLEEISSMVFKVNVNIHWNYFHKFFALKLKGDLDVLFSELCPHLKTWAVEDNLSYTFMSFILKDVEVREQQARTQVHILSRCVLATQ